MNIELFNKSTLSKQILLILKHLNQTMLITYSIFAEIITFRLYQIIKWIRFKLKLVVKLLFYDFIFYPYAN